MLWLTGLSLAGGLLITLVFWAVILMQAYKVSVLWGLGYTFLPPIAAIFIIKYWDQSRRPFLCSLLAIPFYGLTLYLMPAAAA